ncbi:ATP-binding protein [Maribacter sp. 2-571]|uniref:sensor histidine kinase n=1 Tax=Maribacter sp. 2-571 TaxID=3417569 RepID=UPI003D33B22D
MTKGKHHKSLDTTTFLRIRKWYLWALAAIALTIIIAQVLIQLHLNSQLNDSRVINVAGRQRAYSQKLVKAVLLLTRTTDKTQEHTVIKEIQKTLEVWKTSHLALQLGADSLNIPMEDDPAILSLFQKLQPHHSAMVMSGEHILKTGKAGKNGSKTAMDADVSILLENERPFLELMDTIVNEYDKRSKAQLQNLKQKEYWLLAFSLLLLLLEMLFIFRPLSIQIRNTISDLVRSRSNSDAHAREVQELFSEKEKSLQELQELNFVIDNAALFASARKDGSIVFMSKKFLKLLGAEKEQLNTPLSELLTSDEGQQQYLKEVLKSNRKNNIRNEEIQITTREGIRIWLDISIVPMHQASKQQSILILCSDISERKRNALKVEQLTREHFEERMLQKKMQASQIVEGQEEERKRIAKDIHDGIGQMLTALRFNIESIDIENTAKTAEKIAYLKSLTADLIKGVRTATFNLTPPELTDHGIFPALHKMSTELSKLTGKNILYENKAEAQVRLSSLAETNIYRVTQEAVNNAIKYSQANYILISINFKDDMLSIVVDDDGKGFDPNLLDTVPKNNSEGGMGLFFMKERISYINGRLFINSRPGKGTRVTINYKTNNQEEVYGT